ncbi:amidase signature enzyme [Viridothelium virens]|uniref:Amidase signature enzyme n=1 Tax=Viridothelium virens TaxID=1048519 RepID=A0A6A6H9J5_VIRVR|nr:amidase signature enzyme [Viridothelium virens]
MPAPTKLWSLTATEVLSLIKKDQLTVEDYAYAVLGRVESRDSVVKAWQYFDPDVVLSQARALDRVPRDQRGPLRGVAIGVKDIMDTKDMPTEYGSPLYKGNRPNADSSPVEIFRKSGALIFGKTTTTEFTILNSGPNTTNPHHAYRIPGGSSAGSAAAVADFQVPLSCGTQTGGSVVSLELDTFGYFARSMEDLKLITDVFNVTADEPVKDIPLKETKVGFLKTPFWPSAGLGTVVAMEKAANILWDHDVTVEEIAAKYSVLITPSAADEAPLGLGDMGDADFNFVWTGAHMPVINVPAFAGPNGMPMGLSLIARRFGDQHLLSIAKVLSRPLMSEGGWQATLFSTMN